MKHYRKLSNGNMSYVRAEIGFNVLCGGIMIAAIVLLIYWR